MLYNIIKDKKKLSISEYLFIKKIMKKDRESLVILNQPTLESLSFIPELKQRIKVQH